MGQEKEPQKHRIYGKREDGKHRPVEEGMPEVEETQIDAHDLAEQGISLPLEVDEQKRLESDAR